MEIKLNKRVVYSNEAGVFLYEAGEVKDLPEGFAMGCVLRGDAEVVKKEDAEQKPVQTQVKSKKSK